MPPLPPIPEALHSNLTQSNFGKMVKRIRSKSSLGTREATNLDNATASTPAVAEITKTPRKLKMPFRRSTKSVISSPELQPRHDVPSPFDLTYSDFTNFVPSQSAPASRRQSSTSPCESAYPRVDDPEDGPVLWKVAPPRLSPMEFARSRLIQAALERREGSSMSTGLTKLWFWTPRWESFLMLPRKPIASDPVAPSEVQSSAETLSLETNEDLIMLPESNGQAQVETDRRSFLSCPRLSLNLGNLAVQFPSMLNLMALDAIHPFKSLSSSTKSGSPPDSGESSRVTKRSSIYAEQTETTRILFPLGRGSQNQTIDQGTYAQRCAAI